MGKFKPFRSLSALYRAARNPVVGNTGAQDAFDNAALNGFVYAEYHDAEDHTLIVKRFNKGSYNGPTERDFKRRLEIIYETAKMKLTEQFNDQQFNQTEYEIKLKKIEDSRLLAFNQIITHCKIMPVPISDLSEFGKKELEAFEENELIPRINKAQKYIQQFVSDALAVIDPNAFENERTLKAGLLAFAADESRLTAEKGRPNYLNLYPTPAGDVERVSMQRVVGDAIPSTERRGEPLGKLPNFVECGIGYRNQRGKFVRQFKGYRHSSYPTIKVQDDFERQKNTALTVQDMLSELARKEILYGNKTDPIRLKLSSLTLLSPISIIEKKGLTDALFLPEGESEYRQLQESYNALMMYNHRVIDLIVDGKPIKVELEANLVNAAANPFGVYAAKQGLTGKRLAQSNLEKFINAEGMNRYIEQTEDYLITNGIALPFKNLKRYSSELVSLRKQLIEANKQLESCLMSGNQSGYAIAQQEISFLKVQTNTFEVELMRERKKLYVENREKIKAYLEGIKDQEPKSKETQIAELYYQSIAMYMDGKIEPTQFGVRYLLVNEKMGSSVDFFCKSGEDRTGRVQNLLEELCEFNRSKGHFPGYNFKTKGMDEDDVKDHRTIAKYVSEFSVSRDINDENVHGARGLQIGSLLDLNKELPNASGDKLGKTAKAVFAFDSPRTRTIKAVFGFDSPLTRTMQNAQGNVLVEENSMQGFVSRIVREKDRDEYEKTKATSSPPLSEIIEVSSDEATYQSKKIDRGDLVVIEKAYEFENDAAGVVNKPVVGRLEKNLKSIRDVTAVPKGGLPINVSEDMAFQQAYAMLSPPFKAKNNPLIIKGKDDRQVARVHAALLVLKNAHPSLKDLIIYVQGNSAVPSKGESKAKQKAADELFIKQQLSEPLLLSNRKQELVALIDKQHSMKAVVALGRKEQEGLNVIEGAQVRPFSKK
jgi:hypothetical protein